MPVTETPTPLVLVAAQIYSGEGDPAIELGEDEIEAVAKTLVNLKPTERRPSFNSLPHGFRIESRAEPRVPQVVRVHKGLIGIYTGDGAETWYRDSKGLNRLLTRKFSRSEFAIEFKTSTTSVKSGKSTGKGLRRMRLGKG
ncbi:MAG: hypothetical protein QF681_14855 [Vicinamibacterales bacterium]|nr:hypothetical protein [Vicinamibacterales bacterium]